MNFTVARDGKVSDTATDSRYEGMGTVASGSTIGSNGTIDVTVAFGSFSVVRSGVLHLSGSSLSGVLVEANGLLSGPTFGYTLTRASSN